MTLACSDTKKSTKSHFDHFWVIDLTSEVTGWPSILNSGVNCFVLCQATRCFYQSSSSLYGAKCEVGLYAPPPCDVKDGEMGRWRLPARIESFLIHRLYKKCQILLRIVQSIFPKRYLARKQTCQTRTRGVRNPKGSVLPNFPELNSHFLCNYRNERRSIGP